MCIYQTQHPILQQGCTDTKGDNPSPARLVRLSLLILSNPT